MDIEFNILSYNFEDLESFKTEAVGTRCLDKLILNALNVDDSKVQAQAFSSIMTIKSKILAFECQRLQKSIDPTKYTPFRSNQLAINGMLNNQDRLLTPRKEMIKTFIQGFWNACSCNKDCFTRASISYALDTYERYTDMNTTEKSTSIGTLLEKYGDRS